jgi:uncharacterized protein (DUF362 family)
VDITINYSADILNAAIELLDASGLKTLVPPGARVSIKPNLVMAKPAHLGATTHPEVVEGLIIYLRGLGVRDIEIIESAWVGGHTKRAFEVCGYGALSKKYGVPLYDLKDDASETVRAGEYTFDICRRAARAEFLINAPVLKAHCQTKMTCCLKNLKGCITDREKRRFHAMGLHKPIAYLNAALPARFCVVDAICGDMTFEEGGNPVTRNMLLAGSDPLLIDSYCAPLLGCNVGDIDYLGIASAIGVGKLFDGNAAVTELNAGNKPRWAGRPAGNAARWAQYINEDSACSACYAALVHALGRAGPPPVKIDIGQGFRGKPGALGWGDCTSCHERHVPGCPPAGKAPR